MKLSTRMRYGTRALVQLAQAYPDKVVSVREIALAQKISSKYLEQIMAPLRSANLVDAIRGVRGGYKLKKSPDQISLLDLYQALEGTTSPVECLDQPNQCENNEVCPTMWIWREIGAELSRLLSEKRLSDLAKRPEPAPVPVAPQPALESPVAPQTVSAL